MKLSSLFLLFITTVIFLPQNVRSQTISNAGFENWTSSGNPPPFDWEEPTGWRSNNALVEWSFAVITRSSHSYAGSYSCALKTSNAGGGDIPGVLVNGAPILDTPNSTIKIITGGTPIASRPNKLSGYYTYPPTIAGDTAFAICILKRYDLLLNKRDTIGYGEKFLLPTVDTTYSGFDLNINYTSSAIPDSIIIAFYSTLPYNPKPGGIFGNTLTIDALSLTTPSGVLQLKGPEYDNLIYPNPGINKFSINLSNFELAEELEFKIFDVAGRMICKKRISNKDDNMFELNTKPGIYFYSLYKADKDLVHFGKLIIQ